MGMPYMMDSRYSYLRYATLMLLCIFAAIAGGIALYVLFLPKKNEGKYTGFLGWLYDFLNFKTLMIEVLLKVLYLITACYITLNGLWILVSHTFLTGFTILVVGNVIARIGYEFILMLVLICKNVSDINKKLNGKSVDNDDVFMTEINLTKEVEQTENNEEI